MSSRKVTSVTFDEHTKERIVQAADEDHRQIMDEIRYLVDLGLRVRERRIELENIAVDQIAEGKRQAE